VHSPRESQSALFNAFRSAYLHRHLHMLACISFVAGILLYADWIQGRQSSCAPSCHRPDGRPSTADSTNTPAVCRSPHPARNEGMGARQRSICLLRAVTDARSTNSATSLAGCNCAVRCINRQSFELCYQTNVFLLGIGYIIILSKCVKSYKCQSAFSKDRLQHNALMFNVGLLYMGAVHCTPPICILRLCA